MQKVIITGASGLVGARLCHDLSKDFEVIAIGGPSSNLELKLDFNKSLDILKNYKPDYFIHCAAIASPEACEKNKELANIVNLKATKEISEFLPKNTKLIFISTDLVFESYSDAPINGFCEEDKTSYFSHYSYTKAMAENYVLDRANSIVIRICLSLDLLVKRGSLFNTIQTLKSKQQINCYYDELRTPLILKELSEAIIRLTKVGFPNKEIFHLCSGSKMSRLELGELIAQIWLLDSDLANDLINKKSISKHLGLVKRAKNVALNDSKIRRLLNLETKNFKQQLIELKADFSEHDFSG